VTDTSFTLNYRTETTIEGHARDLVFSIHNRDALLDLVLAIDEAVGEWEWTQELYSRLGRELAKAEPVHPE